MSRLFYDPPASAKMVGVQAENNELKSYLEKISKIIPAEIVAAYLTLTGFIKIDTSTDDHQMYYVLAFGLCMVATYLYLNAMAEAGKPKAIHLILSILAFAVWAYSTTGDHLCPQLYRPLLASFAPVGFSLLTVKIPLS